MSEHTETIDTVDDKELFQAAIEEVPEAKEPEPQAEPEKAEAEERPRDDKGRFVAKESEAAEPKDAAQPQPTDDKPQLQVPSWRLAEEAENRRRAEQALQDAQRQAWEHQRQVAELNRRLNELSQPKQEPVDFFQDPQAALQQSLNPFEQRFASLAASLTLRASKAEAIALHGKQAVAEMETALDAAVKSGHPEMPLLSHQMRSSDDPVGVAMQWFQKDKLVRDTGGDLEKFKAKLMEDMLKDPSFQAKAIELARGQAASQPGARPNISLPPSLNKATGAGNAPTFADDDMSDAALFRHAISGKR